MDDDARRSPSPSMASDASANVNTAAVRSTSSSCSQEGNVHELIHRIEQAPQTSDHHEAPTTAAHPLGLDFPTLNSDGSIESLTSHSSRPYVRTPPAALSSLGIKAKMQRDMHLSESSSSLDSTYEIVDYLSEISNDDHDTASLASNDGEVTLDAGSDVDDDEEEDLVVSSTDYNRPHEETTADSYVTLPSRLVTQKPQVSDNERQQLMKVENDLLDSYMSEDLDTPRQSILSTNLGKSVYEIRAKQNVTLGTRTATEGKTLDKHLVPQSKQAKADSGKKAPSVIAWWKVILAAIIATVPYILLFALRITTHDPTMDLLVRRDSLSIVLMEVFNTTQPGHLFDIEHLLPQPSADCVVTDIFGRHSINPACTQDVRYQGVLPNHMLVALPGHGRFPQLASTSVVKADGHPIDFNQTELIAGVHAITLDPHEAHGTVTVSMNTTKPPMDFTASYNYGNRMLQRKTYENAGTDVSKAVGKEVAVMRAAARTLKDKLSTELKIGYQATKSVTTDLALAISRDLQVFAGSAATALGRAANASNGTVVALSKDLMLMQKEMAKFTKDLSTTVSSAMNNAKNETKWALRNPILKSRERLLDIRHAIKCVAWKNRSFRHKKHKTLAQRLRSMVADVPPSQHDQPKALSTVPDGNAFTPTHLSAQGTHAIRQAQRQVTRAMQQLDRVSRHIKRKEQEIRDTGDHAARKELRKLKKDYKEREKALKKLVEDLKRT